MGAQKQSKTQGARLGRRGEVRVRARELQQQVSEDPDAVQEQDRVHEEAVPVGVLRRGRLVVAALPAAWSLAAGKRSSGGTTTAAAAVSADGNGGCTNLQSFSGSGTVSAAATTRATATGTGAASYPAYWNCTEFAGVEWGWSGAKGLYPWPFIW